MEVVKQFGMEEFLWVLILREYISYEWDDNNRLVCKLWKKIIDNFKRRPIDIFSRALSEQKKFHFCLPYLKHSSIKGRILWSCLKAKNEELLDYLIDHKDLIDENEWKTVWGKMLQHKDEDDWEKYCQSEREWHDGRGGRRVHYCFGITKCSFYIYYKCSNFKYK